MSDQTEQPRELTTSTGVSEIGTTLSVSMAAARLGVSEKTVRRMIAAGKLEGAAKTQGVSGETWAVPLAAVESHLSAKGGQPAGQVAGRGSGQGERVQELEREVIELRHAVELRDMQLAEKERYLQTLEALTSRMLPAATQPARRKWWRKKGEQPAG